MPALTSAAQNPPARRPDAKPNTQAQYLAASESENVNFAHDKKNTSNCSELCLQNAMRFKKKKNCVAKKSAS